MHIFLKNGQLLGNVVVLQQREGTEVNILGHNVFGQTGQVRHHV